MKSVIVDGRLLQVRWSVQIGGDEPVMETQLNERVMGAERSSRRGCVTVRRLFHISAWASTRVL